MWLKSAENRERRVKGRVLFFVLFVEIVLFSSLCSATEIKIVSWRDLSDADLSPSGRFALSLNPETWKHAETEHFVYHFTDPKEAETITIHAEVYYRWIKDFLGVRSDRWRKKSHIFVFSQEDAWKRFLEKAAPELLEAGGFTDGWELFLYRAPYWLSPRKILAHEMTHLILFRFLEGPLPLFLNEGFSEFVSYRALAVQFGGNEYDLRTPSRIPREKFIAPEKLEGMRTYPEDALDVFYRESEWLVRFLTASFGRENFYSLLRGVSRGSSFGEALKTACGMDVETFRQKFEAYAVSGGE